MSKKIFFIPATMVLFVVLAFSYSIKDKPDNEKSLSIEKAINEGVVSAKFKGAGTYSGESVELEIKNLLSVDTLIRIEAGRRLTSDDTTLQDILIVKELELFLAANEIKRLKLFGFCCQAHNGAPGYTGFKAGYMEDSAFVVLANYLAQSNLPTDVMQSAIWVMSDKHSLSSIHSDNEKDKEKVKNLYKLISALKGIDYVFPWYTLKYKTDTARVFSGRPSRMFAEVDYYLGNNSSVDLFIKDANDILVKKMFVNRPHHRGEYTYRFTLDVANMPQGKYYLRLYADNQLKMEKVFEL